MAICEICRFLTFVQLPVVRGSGRLASNFFSECFMPYVKRDASQQVIALLREPEPGAETFLPPDAPEVLAFLYGDKSGELAALDLEFIRVIEDVIDLLVDHKVIRFTDLPVPVQDKLNRRRSLRSSDSSAFSSDIIPL